MQTRTSNRLSFIRWLAVILIVAAPAWTQEVTIERAEQTDSPESALQERGDVGLYVLQIGDEIEVKVFQIPELQDTVRIRSDGRISVLLLDDIESAGMTTAQLDAVLTERYAEFYRDPQVTVIVRGSANLKVYVGGEVAAPGLLALHGELTALGAIVRAGGFRDSANRTSVILLRKGPDNNPVVMRINLKDVIHEGAADAPLRPFDVVYVPRTFIAKANLFVKQYFRDLLPLSTNANFTWIMGSRGVVVP